MRLSHCHNIADLRALARQRLPGPVFDYIDGGADDELTLRNNTAAFDRCDLIPSVLRDISDVDLGVTLFGHRIGMPLYCSPTALQRLFHVDGELAVARAARTFSTLFGVSSLATVSLETIAASVSGPKIFQFYYHRDRSLNEAMLAMAKEHGFDVLALTVDTATGGKRERDLRSGFTSPIRLTARSALSFALHPRWAFDYSTGPAFDLPLLSGHVRQGSGVAVSVADYFSTMLEPSLNWEHVKHLRAAWDGPFCLKGVMSVADARRAAELGLDGVIVSNHGGRQLDGSATPFSQLAAIVDAVGERMEVICDGGIRRGSHVVKALAMGARACSGGRFYLYGLAGAGQPGVEKALELMRDEIKRAMILMGKRSVSELCRSDLDRNVKEGRSAVDQ